MQQVICHEAHKVKNLMSDPHGFPIRKIKTTIESQMKLELYKNREYDLPALVLMQLTS